MTGASMNTATASNFWLNTGCTRGGAGTARWRRHGRWQRQSRPRSCRSPASPSPSAQKAMTASQQAEIRRYDACAAHSRQAAPPRPSSTQSKRFRASKLPAERIGQPEKQAGKQPWAFMGEVLGHPYFVVLTLFQDNKFRSPIIPKRVRDDDSPKAGISLLPGNPAKTSGIRSTIRSAVNPGPPRTPMSPCSQRCDARRLERRMSLREHSADQPRQAHRPIPPSPARARHGG
jgi:hypothetical protein